MRHRDSHAPRVGAQVAWRGMRVLGICSALFAGWTAYAATPETQLPEYRISAEDLLAGGVNNPGQYVLGRYVDVLQAINLAGGLTPFADDNDIKFNYSQVLRGRKLEQNILLQTDDVVVVS